MIGSAFIIVTHLLGVGHLVRAAALGRAFAKAGWRVTVATGGRPAPHVDLAPCDVAQLPPVHVNGTDFRTLLQDDGRVADAVMMERRSDALIATFDACEPDVVVTELYPFGRRQLAAEMDRLLEHARAREPRPAILSSIRDVLHPPADERRAAWSLEKLGEFYDAVLFHGDEHVTPLSASWPTTPALTRRIRPTGYVRDAAKANAAASAEAPDDVLVSGGGSDAGLHLARVAIEAARLDPTSRWRILVGQGVGDVDFTALRAAASASLNIERARPDFPTLLARAYVSVSQAGYNTTLDLAAAHARAVLVPFAQGAEQEQTIRARCLAERKLARVIAEDQLTVARLAAEVAYVRDAPRPDWSVMRLDGAERAVQIVASEATRASERVAAWRKLRALLDEMRRAGRSARVWVRDDDIAAPSATSERFLRLMQQREIPVALAVIPARASADLPAWLAGFQNAVAVAHGWAHVNHAPAGMKRAEFPVERSEGDALNDFRKAEEKMRSLFAQRALPVFVPPWNRMAPGLASHLQGHGFAGLSMFAPRRSHSAASGFVRNDAHWDPIDWPDGGLRDEAALIRSLVRLLAQDLTESEGLEPLGLLTYHLVHDRWIDRFLDEVFDELSGSDVVQFMSARDVFTPARASEGTAVEIVASLGRPGRQRQ